MESYTRREALKLFAGVAVGAPRVVDRLAQAEVLKPEHHYGFVNYDEAMKQDFANQSVSYYQAGTLLRYQEVLGEHSLVKIKHDSKPYNRPGTPLAKGEHYFLRRLLRPVTEAELAPISPQVPVSDKRIVVDIKNQRLMAYERGEPILESIISSGRENLTPRREFPINSRRIARYMQPKPEYSNQHWDHPGVPWVLYFGPKGEAIHGAFWHDDFGSPVSSGCINLQEEHARFLWRWTSPHPTNLQVEEKLCEREERVMIVII